MTLIESGVMMRKFAMFSVSGDMEVALTISLMHSPDAEEYSFYRPLPTNDQEILDCIEEICDRIYEKGKKDNNKFREVWDTAVREEIYKFYKEIV